MLLAFLFNFLLQNFSRVRVPVDVSNFAPNPEKKTLWRSTITKQAGKGKLQNEQPQFGLLFSVRVEGGFELLAPDGRGLREPSGTKCDVEILLLLRLLL